MSNKYKTLSKLEFIDKGVLFMLLSALVATLSGATAKVLSQTMDPIEIVFYRNFLGVIIILYSFKKIPVSINTSKLHLLFLRGILGTIAMLLFFYTIATIPLGEAVILNKTSLFFVTILAYYLMKESISINTIFALIIGFVGVILIIKPFGIEISIEHILGILGGFFAAAAYATIKKIKDIYDARVIMLSFMGIGVIIPLLLFLFTPYVEFKIHTDLLTWSLIILMAILSTVSQWFLTRAYSLSRASIIGVVGYSSIPFAVGFGVMLGDSLPDIYTLFGIALIVFGGILVSKNSSNKKS
jgi:drug/metabolite transporter (DMT)-like permease